MLRHTISLCLLIVAADVFAAEPSAAELLQQVRDRYRRMEAYHFVRRVIAEEVTNRGSKKVADVTFVTASVKDRGAAVDPDDWKEQLAVGRMPFNYSRFRFEARDKNGGTSLGADGQTRWISSATTKEYRLRTDGRAVTGPTGGALFAAMLMPLSNLIDESLQSPEFAADADLEIGDVRRKCRVIRGVIKSPTNLLSGPEALFMHMQMTGLALPDKFATPGGGGKAPTFALWTDTEDGRILQIVSELGDREKSQLRVTETFQIARLERVPDEVFRFVPPEGAKEVAEFTPAKEKDR